MKKSFEKWLEDEKNKDKGSVLFRSLEFGLTGARVQSMSDFLTIRSIQRESFEAGQKTTIQEALNVKHSYSAIDVMKLDLNDPKDRMKWYYMHLHDMDTAASRDDLRDEWFLELFEGIWQKARKSRWIPVTERLPTEKDGKKRCLTENRKGDYVIRVLCQTELGGARQNESIQTFDLTTNHFIWLDEFEKVIAWQPLPEA